MKVALVLHGDAPSDDDLALLKDCDAIVCADGGARFLAPTGRVPDVVVGDLDSLGEEEALRLEAAGCVVERHPARKAHTDGELALARVLAMKPERVLLLGAHGADTAHALANLHLLRRCHEAGVAEEMVGHGERLRFASPGRDVLVPGEGREFSVLPQEADAVVDLEGAVYPLTKARLALHEARGLSNRVAGAEARVRVREGCVLVVARSPPSHP